ncbi:MAG TPA: minor capsid protein [Methanocorpusculum sp.]|nr:minor capsid protein [Methanocorpusculum sp.]HJJ49780.1 minor capsid protein [Methanocorpusculum sp.]HJJ57382.1 minor capsid protein [Methanocorpusculum sp.]
MMFGYDVCTYLRLYHSHWDDTVVTDGFHLNTSGLSASCPDTGESLYLNQVPNDTINCICVYETGGYSPLRFHGAEKPFDNPTAQVRIRHASLRVAEMTADRIHELMDEVYQEIINDRFYLRINSVSPPSYIGCDQVTTAGKAYEFVLNLNSTVKRL